MKFSYRAANRHVSTTAHARTLTISVATLVNVMILTQAQFASSIFHVLFWSLVKTTVSVRMLTITVRTNHIFYRLKEKLSASDEMNEFLPVGHNFLNALYSDYLCDCHWNYTGINCENFIPCSIEPCFNNGTCSNINDFSGYTCSCPFGYTGADCEIPILCLVPENPCQNGVCLDFEDFSGYTCDCNDTVFTGEFCEIVIPCSSSPCENAGFCEDVNGYSGEI